MPHSPASDVLSHIKVLDLTRVRSGPTAVRQLADWGADVIKIEAPESLEPDGSLGAKRHTPDFQNLQRNKRSLTLNLKDPEGLEIFYKLVADADVVVENFRPDVKERLGVDYPKLKEVNPRVILASISGFGQDGPYAKRPGFDQIAQGMCGLMSITGEPGRGPMRVGIPIADLTSGMFCAHGILLALIERDKSGEGQWIQTSLLQAQIFMLDFQAARWLMTQEVPGQAGNNHPTSIPTGVFSASDGELNLAVAGNNIWERFCKAIDKEEWLADPRFTDNADRLTHRDELNDLIAEVFKTRTRQEWVDKLAAVSVPCGRINKINEVFDDPQVQHVGIATEGDSVPYGKTHYVGQPIKMSRTPSNIVARPPERGEQTEEILGSIGIDAEAIKALREKQIV